MTKAHHHHHEQQEACCTCATLLSRTGVTSSISLSSEKSLPDRKELNRRLDCCSRTICADCIHKNPRFLTYCPYCQTSGRSSSPSPPSPLPSSQPGHLHLDLSLDLQEPPPYSPPSLDLTTSPPAYSPSSFPHPPEKEKSEEDTLHFLSPSDSIPSLSLTYNVPPHILRSHNNLPSDHLLAARRTILIPASHHKSGISHSPRPVDGEEEELRKSKIRRWMVACKEHDYDVALLYLEAAGYDLDEAVARYADDERWEREHPLQKGKSVKHSSSKKRGKVGGWGLFS
ncbi:hypothetical protein QBC35DRAFT_491395 [Podospora australis]|uniref:Uncharacterized protein n=1 Tax=Podospora australis TaxID=1536484 RepID=A0AAN6WXK9_9PEZI|nr:hypothetical protein QBC35DRAFT_491395 [Podospora australis]